MEISETTRSLAEHLVQAHLHEHTFGSTHVQQVRATIQTDCANEAALYIEVTLSEPPERAWPADDTQAIRWRILETLTSALPGLNFYTKFRVGKPAHAGR